MKQIVLIEFSRSLIWSPDFLLPAPARRKLSRLGVKFRLSKRKSLLIPGKKYKVGFLKVPFPMFRYLFSQSTRNYTDFDKDLEVTAVGVFYFDD